ncbi:unnamed protein product [Lactuca saligna]|uniref:Uncharacterized protein n=1 Tax=Lactuca saligna TaxID=75948 RepID=A0AA35ZGB8_LACSI|nr:unnamed protein product [Lactuca saligna]
MSSLQLSSLKEFHRRSSLTTRHLIVTVGSYRDPSIGRLLGTRECRVFCPPTCRRNCVLHQPKPPLFLGFHFPLISCKFRPFRANFEFSVNSGGALNFPANQGNVEVARAQAPTGMDLQRWNAAIDHFLTEKHQKRSAGNKEYRKKQLVKNRGGTCSYGSACFKKVDLQTHHIADSGGDPYNIDLIAIFEKVLGTRKGHDVDVNAFLQNPAFVTTIGNIIRSFKNQVNEENNDEKDDGEDEDN